MHCSLKVRSNAGVGQRLVAHNPKLPNAGQQRNARQRPTEKYVRIPVSPASGFFTRSGFLPYGFGDSWAL